MDSQFIFHISDHLNSSSLDLSITGTLLQATDYLPFGKSNTYNVTTKRVKGKKGGYTNKYLFANKQEGPESDLQYFEKRYYDNRIGRFTTEDPVFWEVGLTKRSGQYFTDPQQWNSYSYVRNNPINYTDPTGELPVDTLVDLGFTVADATILTYYNAQAIYNQFMAIQNIDNYEVYRSYQDKANEYEQKAGEKLADLGMDAISTATPYVSAGITRSAKMAFQAAAKTEKITLKSGYTLSKHVLDNAKLVEGRNIPAMVINDAIKNGQKITEGVKKGTVEYISTGHNINGSNVNLRVVVNPETKTVITVIPTSTPTTRPTTN